MKRLAAAHEVEQGLLLRVGERQVAVGHHHHAVELVEVFGREEREVELLRILLVALDRRHLEAAGLAKLDDGFLGRPEAGVLVERGVREEQQLLGRLRRRAGGGGKPRQS